ncbi:hypothetical protein JCM21900_004871 [Sporobolomyces salmonicolor]
MPSIASAGFTATVAIPSEDPAGVLRNTCCPEWGLSTRSSTEALCYIPSSPLRRCRVFFARDPALLPFQGRSEAWCCFLFLGDEGAAGPPYLAHKKLAPFDLAHTSPTSPVLFAGFAVPALRVGVVYEHEGARGKSPCCTATSRPPPLSPTTTGASSPDPSARPCAPVALAKPEAQAELERTSAARLEEEVGGWLQALATAAGPSQLAGGVASPADDQSHEGRLWVSSFRPL